MPAQVTNYQCPNCTGPLQFNAETGKLGCEFCGSSFTNEEIEALYAASDAAAAEAQEQAETRWKAEESTWDTEDGTLRAYSCPACCAELICDETTAATACPYCGNPTIVPGKLDGALKPDVIIPFKLEKADAVAALKKHCEGRPFLPKTFKDQAHLEEIKGVYVPFWLFDGEAQGQVSYHATKVRHYVSGDYNVTETRHFRLFRQGRVGFSRIPVDGSNKMSDDYMDSLEPFNYNDLTEFSTAYLPGFFADKYDVSMEACAPRADARAENTLADALRGTTGGYSSVTEHGRHIRLERGAVKYALLPVWVLSTKWNGQNHLFTMNGQTGKMVGDLPIDKKKRRRVFWLTYLALAAVGLLVALLL